MQAPDLGFQTAPEILGAKSTVESKSAAAEQATEPMRIVHAGIASSYHRRGKCNSHPSPGLCGRFSEHHTGGVSKGEKIKKYMPGFTCRAGG